MYGWGSSVSATASGFPGLYVAVGIQRVECAGLGRPGSKAVSLTLTRCEERLADARAAIAGPAIAYYEERPDGGVMVHAAMPVNAEQNAGDFAVVDLPGIEQAGTVVHRGSTNDVVPTVQTLARWIDNHGYRSVALHREVTLAASEDCQPTVTELQEPITR